MTHCPACGEDVVPWLDAVPAADEPVFYALDRCWRCGTAVTRASAVPAARDPHETGDYAPGRPRGARIARPLLALYDRQRLRLVRELVGDGARLLDVGAGRGRFVAAARRHGFPEARGLEPSRRGVAGAREDHGIELDPSGIDDAEVAAGSQDAVTLWHVLEHVEDPAAALDRIASWVRPGGGLVVGVPNVQSLQARLAGRRWYHLDVPRHRTHFSVRGLHELLRGHGFVPLRTQHLLAEHNPFGMWQAWVGWTTSRPSYLYHLLKRSAPLDPRDLALTLLALPLVPLAVAVEGVAGFIGQGGTVAVVARRADEPTPVEHP